MPFEEYAEYYDLFYADKPYEEEACYVDRCLRQKNSGIKTILDMGCGSGTHDLILAQKGYRITGVDIAEAQLRSANTKLQVSPPEPGEVAFHLHDIRNLRLQRKFDAVISLFHVMSYQIENEDIVKCLQTARAHLDRGGLFLFDAWYGPAVLTDGPETRVRRFELDSKKLVRIAEPEMKSHQNRVDVHYELLVSDVDGRRLETIRETHSMRYFFLPEISYFLEQTGFSLLNANEFLTGKPLGNNTWNCCFLAQVV